MKDKLKQKTEVVAKVRDVSGTQRRARRREGEKEAATQKRSGSQEIRTLELALQAKTEEVVALVKEAERYIRTWVAVFSSVFCSYDHVTGGRMIHEVKDSIATWAGNYSSK